MLLSEHPAALAAPVSSSREGGVWSELLTILATGKKKRVGSFRHLQRAAQLPLYLS